MNDLKKLLEEFEKYPTPYYFIGAGISRRYLDTPDWETLLKEICEKYSIQFNKLLYNSANKRTNEVDYSLLGSMLKERLTEYKVENDNTYDFRVRDALKEEVVNILKEKHLNLIETNEVVALRKILKKSSGVITTNYDLLIETLDSDKDFESYIGQKGIISENISFSQEIYKIHGCVTEEQSIIITKEDYNLFLEKQKYLLGKLIVIFTEYPMVFLGYKMSDENIRSILRDLSISLSKEELEKISKKWIFVERKEGEKELLIGKREINITTENQENFDLIFNCIETDNFEKLYNMLNNIKNYIPSNKKVIKYMRKIIQKYEFDPESKIGVTFDKEIEKVKNIEDLKLYMGVIGGTIPTPHNVTKDMLFNSDKKYTNELKKEYMLRIGNNKYYPRYFLDLSEFGIKDISLNDISLSGKLKLKELKKYNLKDIIVEYDEIIKTFKNKELDKVKLLKQCEEFLKKIFSEYDAEFDLKKIGSAYHSNIKKIVCIYDILKYKNLIKKEE